MLTLEQYTKIKNEALEIEKKISILQDRREKAEEQLKVKYSVGIEQARTLLDGIAKELKEIEVELEQKYRECVELNVK